MSLQVTVDLVCDVCGETYDGGPPAATGSEVRDSARADAWRVSLPDGRDLCPSCC